MESSRGNTIAEYLLEIYRATFLLNTYSDRWWVWDTIVLRKPGKPRYNVPKAHRPIALMNTLGKLLSTLVAEDLTHMCDYYGLLPDNHFGGRPADAQPMQCIYWHTRSRQLGANTTWWLFCFWM